MLTGCQRGPTAGPGRKGRGVAPGFGVTDFQLMLLRRMADDQPELAAAATASLGAPRSAMADATRRWQARLRAPGFPGGTRRYEIVLGPPAAAFTRPFGELDSEVTRWRLPLWPDLRYETISLPGGPVLQEWLIRPDPATRPALATAADARPWTCVVADLQHGFTDVRHEDGDAPSRWRVLFTAAGEAGAPRRYLARFTWGLLQSVTELDDR
jgi:hypothetical protein